MPEYKLIYFNMRGLAELPRWLFVYSGIPYTDERIEGDWEERKKTIPGGKLPVLMIGDKCLPQSMAIARYVAKQAGLVPSDNLEAAYCDGLADTLKELGSEASKLMRSTKDEEEKKKEFSEFFTNTMSPVMTRLNKRLAQKEWFISDQITWGDFFIARYFGEMMLWKPEIFASFPALKAHVEKVQNLPKIKEWIASRPKTTF